MFVVLVGLELACGPERSDAAASETTAATASVDGTTEVVVSTGSSGAADDGSDTTGPTLLCPPDPDALELMVLLDGEDVDGSIFPQQETCLVDVVSGDPTDTGLHVELSCTDADGLAIAHTLDVFAAPAFETALQTGLEVDLIVIGGGPEQYLAVRDSDGELLLGHFSASHPFESCCIIVDETLFAPLSLSAATDVCDIRCDEAEQSFLPASCPCTASVALDFSAGGATTRIYDHQRDELATDVGLYDIRVDDAYRTRNHDGTECAGPGTPEFTSWYDVLLVRGPAAR